MAVCCAVPRQCETRTVNTEPQQPTWQLISHMKAEKRDNRFQKRGTTPHAAYSRI